MPRRTSTKPRYVENAREEEYAFGVRRVFTDGMMKLA